MSGLRNVDTRRVMLKSFAVFFPRKERYCSVKVSKAFTLSVARWLDLTTLGSRDKHLNFLSHGGVLFLINPGTTIRYRAPPNPPTQPC